MSENASVSGMIKKVDNKFAGKSEIDAARGSISKAFKGLNVVFSLLSFIGALLVGWICLKFFPKASKDSANLISTSLFRSLGIGLLVSIIIIPALILLAITGVGIPLAGLVFLLYLINIYLTKLVVGYSLGIWLSGKFEWKNMSQVFIFAIGLFVVYLLKMIPVLGAFVSLITFWVGLGALFLYYKSAFSKSPSKKS